MKVSLIVPMLNEAAHLDEFIADIANQDFAGELELVVADGGSTDGSPDTVLAGARRVHIEATVLENPAGWVSHGLNLCIAAATGEFLVRLDCHARYPSDYVSKCVAGLCETGADVVGGVIAATGRTRMERSVACAMQTRFGGIGFYRTAGGGDESGRVEADTVTFGAFRRGTFDRVGLYDESLRRNQDSDLNLRVRRSGGRVVLDPAIRVYYRPRGSLREVFRQYHSYGFWRCAVMLKHHHVPGPRNLAPLAFVASLAVLVPLAVTSVAARRLLALQVGLYLVLALSAAAVVVWRRRESFTIIPVVAAVFPAFHVGYGIGMARRLISAAAAERRRSVRQALSS